jgi:hypothetical protein
MPRPLLLIGVLLLAVLGCQSSTVVVAPTETVAPVAAAVAPEPPVLASLASVWGEVPRQCA